MDDPRAVPATVKGAWRVTATQRAAIRAEALRRTPAAGPRVTESEIVRERLDQHVLSPDDLEFLIWALGFVDGSTDLIDAEYATKARALADRLKGPPWPPS